MSWPLCFPTCALIQNDQNTIKRQLELGRLVPDADQTTIRVGQEYDQKQLLSTIKLLQMNSHTFLKSREAAKIKSDSPEIMQQAIAELEKTVAMQYDLLKKTLTENELLQQKVQQLQQQLNDKLNSDGYGSTSSWISKIVFTLQQENRPLRSPELITLLEKREPALVEHYNKVQYFSAFLSNAVKYGRVIQRKMKGVRGYYYLLPQWLDGQGKIKPEFYNKML